MTVPRSPSGWLEQVAAHHRVKLRFLLAGAFNTLLGLSLYPLLYVLIEPQGRHYLSLLVVSQTLCIGVAFLTNKHLVFQSSGNGLHELGKFLGFHLAYFVVNLLVLPLLVEGLGMNPMLAQTGFAICVIVTSYLWHSRITFAGQRGTDQ
jgi:putative flippase GtrA